MWKLCDLDLGGFKVIQGQRFWCQSTAHGWLPIRLLLTPASYLSPFLKYLTWNSNDLELRLFKVIQGQRSWCQSKVHWWFPILPPLCLTLYLSRYSIYLMRKFCDLDLGRFKAIQGQMSCCQSIAYGWLPIRLLLTQRRICCHFWNIWPLVWWPWTRTVQGHPRSKVMVPIDSPCLTSYSSSIDPNAVSVTI